MLISEAEWKIRPVQAVVRASCELARTWHTVNESDDYCHVLVSKFLGVQKPRVMRTFSLALETLTDQHSFQNETRNGH